MKPFFFTQTTSSLPTDDILADARLFVTAGLHESSAVKHFGSINFTANPNSFAGTSMYCRFAEGAKRGGSIAVVFHGTCSLNHDAIQRDGLDPTKRKGQAYGPGEYFGVDMQTSLAYNRKSQRGEVDAMMLFVVVLPEVDSKTASPTQPSVLQPNGANLACAQILPSHRKP